MDNAGYSLTASVNWTPTEVASLLLNWEINAAVVSEPGNDAVFKQMAECIGNDKTAEQVRDKINQMKDKYLDELAKPMSKWRYFNSIKPFAGSFVKRLNRSKVKVEGRSVLKRKVGSTENVDSPTNPVKRVAYPLPVGSVRVLEAGIDKLVQAVTDLASVKSTNELPPIYPYDPDVSDSVAVSSSWKEWNESLPYQLTDAGIKSLIRSGFRTISQISLLKTKTADISMLHLNYHDKLALEQALAAEVGKTDKFELVKNMDGAVVGIHGSVDASDAVLLTDDGLKLMEWNKCLPTQLSLRALAKILKAGFTSSDELLTLMDDEHIDYLDLNLKDRILLKRLIAQASQEKTTS